jgi:hypothetical protein
VLSKLLLCGEMVEANLYDWRSNSIKQLECSVEPYWWLVKICFLEYTPTQFLVDFVISIIAHTPPAQGSMKGKVVESMEIYRQERQLQLKILDVIKERIVLRKIPPKDLKEGLTEFGENQHSAEKKQHNTKKKRDNKKEQLDNSKEIVQNIEKIRGAAMAFTKEIDIPLVAGLFTLEDCIESNQATDSAMKLILESLIEKSQIDNYWLKPTQAAMEIVGWLQLKDNGVPEVLKTVINDFKCPLFVQICTTEALLKLNNKGNAQILEYNSHCLDNVLLSEEEREKMLDIIDIAFESNEQDIKAIAVKIKSIIN